MTVEEMLAAHRAWLERDTPAPNDDPLGIRVGPDPLEGNWRYVMDPVGHALKILTLDATLKLVALLERMERRETAS